MTECSWIAHIGTRLARENSLLSPCLQNQEEKPRLRDGAIILKIRILQQDTKYGCSDGSHEISDSNLSR